MDRRSKPESALNHRFEALKWTLRGLSCLLGLLMVLLVGCSTTPLYNYPDGYDCVKDCYTGRVMFSEAKTQPEYNEIIEECKEWCKSLK